MNTIKSHYIQGTTLSHSPILHTIDQFLSDLEADELIDFARERIKRALVKDIKAGVKSSERHPKHTSLDSCFSSGTRQIAQCISSLVNLPLASVGTFQIAHYSVDEEDQPHYDAWEMDSDKPHEHLTEKSQKILTCILNLNTVKQGGQTIFPKLNRNIQAQKGRIIILQNCFAQTRRRNPLSLYGSSKVEQGEKWVCRVYFNN